MKLLSVLNQRHIRYLNTHLREDVYPLLDKPVSSIFFVNSVEMYELLTCENAPRCVWTNNPHCDVAKEVRLSDIDTEWDYIFVTSSDNVHCYDMLVYTSYDKRPMTDTVTVIDEEGEVRDINHENVDELHIVL